MSRKVFHSTPPGEGEENGNLFKALINILSGAWGKKNRQGIG
jgi:hypothetical protein